MATRVYRSIDRPSRMFGLDYFDAFLWLASIVLLKRWHIYGLLASGLVWCALFSLRYRKPEGFLFNLLRFHGRRLFNLGRFSAALNERDSEPWLERRQERP